MPVHTGLNFLCEKRNNNYLVYKAKQTQAVKGEISAELIPLYRLYFAFSIKLRCEMERYIGMLKEPGSYFDIESLLADDSQLYSDACDGDSVEKFEDITNGKDVSLSLDLSWMTNFVSVGGDGKKYTNNPIPEAGLYTESKSLVDGFNSSTPIPSPCPSSNDKPTYVNDEDLLTLSVKELNRLVKPLPKDDAKDIKHRRRTLKNRGYARSCRVKRQEEKSCLEQNNGGLELDIKLLKLKLKTAMAQRDDYKNKYENLLRQKSVPN